jgi:hypothetical protein
MTDILNATQITNTQTLLAINGILNIINAIVGFIMCFIVDKLGRRPLFFGGDWQGVLAIHCLDENRTLSCGQSCGSRNC